MYVTCHIITYDLINPLQQMKCEYRVCTYVRCPLGISVEIKIPKEKHERGLHRIYCEIMKFLIKTETRLDEKSGNCTLHI